MARIQLPESRIRARRKRRIVRAVVAWTVLLSVIWIILVGISWIPQLRFRSVDVQGAQTVASSTIAAAVNEELAGTYGYMFPRNNVFLYSKQRILSTLLSQFSPLKKVSVSLGDFHTLRVVVSERAPVALWCGEDPGTATACTLLDQNGVAYTQSADFSAGVYVRYFGALATSTPPKFLPGRFETLQALVEVLQQKTNGDRADTVTIDSSSDVRLKLLSGCTLLFSLEQDGASVVSNFVLALGSDAFSEKSLGDFEYVDLRFGDKLYYRLRGVVP